MNGPREGFFRPSISLGGVLLAAGAVAAACSLAGFLGRYSWLLDLFSHFRVQYGAWLAGTGIVLAMLGRRRTALSCLLLAAINLIPVIPLYLPRRSLGPEHGSPLRVVLINVSTRMGDPRQVMTFLHDASPDLIVLEEISGRWMPPLESLTGQFPHRLAVPREDNFGIGIFSRHRFAKAEVAEIGDAEIPSIVASVRTPAGLLRVIATHPPPPLDAAYSNWRNRQLQDLTRFITPGFPLVLIGDLNTTPWNHHFRRLLLESGLHDSARGFGVQPTWPDFVWIFRIPLDHFLHSEAIRILDRKIGPDVGSDHRPVIVDMSIS